MVAGSNPQSTIIFKSLIFQRGVKFKFPSNKQHPKHREKIVNKYFNITFSCALKNNKHKETNSRDV